MARSIGAFFALTSFSIATALPREASANGRMPGANQILFAPGDPNLVLMRVTFGVLISHDAGATWSWMCEAAIPRMPYQYDPMFGITANGSLVGTVLSGLDVTSDLGCTWAPLTCPLTQLSFNDIAVRPNDPHAVLALSTTPNTRFLGDAGVTCPGTVPDAGEDAGALYSNQVLESTDDGAHWAVLPGAIDPRAFVTTVDAAKTDPQRIYVSSFRDVVEDDGSVRRASSMFVSTDHGASWTEHDVPLVGEERAVYIAAIDPTNADRVYIRTASGVASGSRLLVSDDAGATFKSVLTLTGQMLGFALSQDGLKVYAGSLEDGLYLASSSSLTFAKKSPVAIACLASRGEHGDQLWACSNEQNGFLAGMSNDDGATFTPKLHLCGVQGPIACNAGSAGSICGQAFAELPGRLGCASDAGTLEDAGEDAGASADASTDVDASSGANPPGGGSSCGCSMRGGAGAAGFLLGGVIAVASVARRRRKR